MSKTEAMALDERLIKAIAHPLRQRILERLNQVEASPTNLADQLGERLGNVAYHVNVLKETGAVELVDTRQVRGAVEHIYRATARPLFDDEHWARLPLSLRRQLFDLNLQQVWEHIVEAAQRGGLDDPKTHISWTALDLDRRGTEEMAELLMATLERALEIHAESAGRLTGVEEADRLTERTELTMMHYHRPR